MCAYPYLLTNGGLKAMAGNRSLNDSSIMQIIKVVNPLRIIFSPEYEGSMKVANVSITTTEKMGKMYKHDINYIHPLIVAP